MRMALVAALLAILAIGECGASEPAYGDWSDWQLDCSKRASDPNATCAAVRKRICRVEGAAEGVACEQCGGQCKEEVTGDTPPLHIYAAWSDWHSQCEQCS